MKLLTLETSCDETAAAILDENGQVLGSVVASQDELHNRFGGVVPEIASRAHLERILPVVDETLRRAQITLDDLDAVAVANTPGLAGSLLVGLTAAKAICVAKDLPLVAVNHLQAHIYACRLAAEEEVFPCIGLITSGGHSNLYRCLGALDFELLGATIDDAAGEAFDKVAAMLGLPYPGGPSIQKVAENGNPRAHRFPRPFLNDKSRFDFSFSGLKTAVRYKIFGMDKPDLERVNLSESEIADVAASFQAAVVDCLVGKAFLCLEKTGIDTLCVGGGVAANRAFRDRLQEEAQRHGTRLFVAPISLCTDNAIMGAIALERLKAGLTESLDLDVSPGVIRKSS